MATVRQVIDEYIRVELEDTSKTRWPDSSILTFMKQAIHRASIVGQKERISFMRKCDTIEINEGGNSLTLPKGFFTPHSVRETGQNSLERIDIDTYDELNVGTGERFSHYAIEGNEMYLAPVAAGNTSLKIRYYADPLTDDFSLTSQMPWNGRLNIILCDYARVRARNVDRYNTSPDMNLLNELEQRIINMYGYDEPYNGEMCGGLY